MPSPLIAFLMQELRMSEREVLMLVTTAPERYKIYKIKKRNGSDREIAHPASELKLAQRAIINRYLKDLPVHASATAYQPGSSIKKNAEAHSLNRPILKYDFENFFPSITEAAWLAYCSNHNIFEREDAIRAGRLLFRRHKGGRILRLSIGAPSSPLVSNILMFAFDKEISERVAEHKITYTRYADDLTFSAQRTGNLLVVDKILRSIIHRQSSPRLKINESKTNLITPKFSRQVTGLILTNDGRVSLGKDRRRKIRAGIHHFSLGKLTLQAQAKLAGILAFAKDVEPMFYAKMEAAYGADTIIRLKESASTYRRPYTLRQSGLIPADDTGDIGAS